MLCLPACVADANKPAVGYANSCEPKRAPGGIPRLLFLVCSPDYEHPYPPVDGKSPWEDLRNIHAAMCAGILNFSGPVLGQQPRATPIKKQFDSCNTEEISGGNQSVTFQDYGVTADEDGAPNLLEYDFWAWVKRKYKTMSPGWVSCDDMLFLWDGKWAPDISPITEVSNTGNRFFDGILNIPSEETIKPFYVPGLLAMLESFNAEDCYS